jgi:hypothetical protein
MEKSLETTTITTAPPEHPGLDFNLLREEGIRHLQRLSGKIWTDHNMHDPGITILDQLCYALTDLSYRIDYDIKDLLAVKDGDGYASLYSPSKIMTTNAVTLLDIRKIVIDTPGVRNAWVEKVTHPEPAVYLNANKTLSLTNPDETGVPLVIKGLYTVAIEVHNSEGNDIQPAVKRRLMAARNVCEDFGEVRVLESQKVAVWGSVEIGEVEDINEFAAVLLVRLSRFVSPEIRFWSLEEMLAKGKRIDEIVEGPLLDHGFIEDEELIRYGRKKELHTSDFIREIMDVPGVAGVNNIKLSASGIPSEWRLILDTQKTPKIDVIDTLPDKERTTNKNSLVFTKNGFELKADVNTVRKRVEELLKSDNDAEMALDKRDIVVPQGEYRETGNYYSIQRQFPLNYGIGDTGLPDSATPLRVKQAKQLKAYLLFFDQLLANYFAQVDQLKELFSFSNDRPMTYFSQSLLQTVPGADELLDLTSKKPYPVWLETATENSALGFERKNRFLNHLMARFNESFTHYSLLIYDYSNKVKSGSVNAVTDIEPPDQLIRDKAAFLRDYPAISVGRYKAFDYTRPGRFSDPENVSGLEKRIAMKLGIPHPANGQLAADKTVEGFYMMEHILFRPVKEDFTAYLDFLVSKPITAFQDMGDGYVQCVSLSHGLQNGDEIVVNGTKTGKNARYDGTYKVEKVLTDSFQLKMAYDDKVKNEDIASKTISPTWIRSTVDTTFLTLTQPMASFAKSGDAAKTVCKAPGHGLTDGEMIEIIGPETADRQPFPYTGKYAVKVRDGNTFEIERPFTANEPNGRWISVNQKKDPYSLQLTFVFPDWLPRFKDDAFKAFIENTIREETPVHLTVYIRSLNRTDMQQFESAYAVFLDQLSNYKQ